MCDITQTKLRREQEAEGHKRVQRLEHCNNDNHTPLRNFVGSEAASLHAATGNMVKDTFRVEERLSCMFSTKQKSRKAGNLAPFF